MNTKRTLALLVMVALSGLPVHPADRPGGARYKDNGDGTVTDRTSGLIWLKNARCLDVCGGATPDSYGRLSWIDAAKWVAGLRSGLCGLTDGSKAGAWRLPTAAEWEAMVAEAKSRGYTDPPLTNAAGNAQWTRNGDAFDFGNAPFVLYWSSTTDPKDPAYVAVFVFSNGEFTYCDKGGSYNVWPVRSAR